MCYCFFLDNSRSDGNGFGFLIYRKKSLHISHNIFHSLLNEYFGTRSSKRGNLYIFGYWGSKNISFHITPVNTECTWYFFKNFLSFFYFRKRDGKLTEIKHTRSRFFGSSIFVHIFFILFNCRITPRLRQFTNGYRLKTGNIRFNDVFYRFSLNTADGF